MVGHQNNKKALFRTVHFEVIWKLGHHFTFLQLAAIDSVYFPPKSINQGRDYGHNEKVAVIIDKYGTVRLIDNSFWYL